MRATLLLLLLLLSGPVVARGQALTDGPAAPAPVQPPRAESSPPAAAEEMPRPQVVPARAEADALVGEVHIQPEKRPSRALWFFIGVAAVLAVILAVTL